MANRESNVMVTVVDSKAFGQMIREKLSDKLPAEAKLKSYPDLGIVKTKKGTFVLDDDGTGESAPLEKTGITIDFVRDDIMTIMACATPPINASNVSEIPVLPEKVNLAKFIRTFGSRLESNFNEWNTFLTAAEPIE